jgi:hypothetical protein
LIAACNCEERGQIASNCTNGRNNNGQRDYDKNEGKRIHERMVMKCKEKIEGSCN